MKKTHLLLISFLILNAYTYPLYAQFQPGNLKCEHLVNPLGIDERSPRLSWMLKDNRHGAFQSAYRVIVGKDSLSVARGIGDEWDTQQVESNKILVRYAGKQLTPFTKYYWQVQLRDKEHIFHSSEIASFETGMIHMKNWKGTWISDGHELHGNSIHMKPAPYFRKEFTINKKIKSARSYIAVAGLYELYLNGKKIGNHRLDPMYTRFDRRNLYVTYDITDALQEGNNTIGVLLGNGWYNHQSTAVWYFDRAPWRNRPAFCYDMHVTYEDGSQETISSGKDWKTSLSHVVFNSIYTAEHHDARLYLEGWNISGFDDSQWKPATIRSAPSTNIVSQQLHPIRNTERIEPKSVKKINDTIYLFDLGRNISGVTEFRIKGESGTTFRLKHAELLGKDGRVNMSNIDAHYRPTDDSDPFQTDIYTLKGNGEETFMPYFNYKGFQYIEIESDRPITLTKDNLTGWFMHSDLPSTGRFECSNPTMNKIWNATNNSYLSNLFGYPTDCPQREKNGWTGDAHIAIETALFNFDGITVYEKWLADHRDEQQPNGVLPAIIPTSGWGYHWANGLDWTSTIAIIPWSVYQFYGDTKLLEDCYDNIKLYVDHVTDMSPEGLTSWGLGDWIPVKTKTSVELTSSIYYFADAEILANTAKLFNKKEDYEKYSALAVKIKNAINTKYFNTTTGVYEAGGQTALSAPLFWGVVPDEQQEAVAKNLANRVNQDNQHLDVGLLGTKTILNALSENGYADLAYTIASQETFPSWGWWIVNGATTLYENWPIDAKSDLSLNHIMFGEISAWLYKALGGINIDPENPGFKNILFKPNFVKGLDYVKTNHTSPFGEIVSNWNRKKTGMECNVVIPANSSADFFIPSGYNLKRIRLVSGEVLKVADTNNCLKLESGNYLIELTKKR